MINGPNVRSCSHKKEQCIICRLGYLNYHDVSCLPNTRVSPPVEAIEECYHNKYDNCYNYTDYYDIP